MNNWVVYILECKDKTFYTGITNNLERRLHQHENGTGAKYTKGRGPFKVIYQTECKDRSDASVKESYIKAMSKQEKIKLIELSDFSK